jgi:hypothetical protein
MGLQHIEEPTEEFGVVDLLQSVLTGLRGLGIDMPVGTTAEELRRQLGPSGALEGEIEDDSIELTIRGGKLDGKEVSVSALIVKLTAEPLEAKHLKSVNGELQATGPFVMELTNELQAMGHDVTPVVATELWKRASAYFSEAQKKTN